MNNLKYTVIWSQPYFGWNNLLDDIVESRINSGYTKDATDLINRIRNR